RIARHGDAVLGLDPDDAAGAHAPSLRRMPGRPAAAQWNAWRMAQARQLEDEVAAALRVRGASRSSWHS
ncbi:MAG TPA: hypothetical protein VJ644_00430, partial [Jiangellaceae bacterium]|nr:hypothetical protein [Jiangellaceae bacterium]